MKTEDLDYAFNALGADVHAPESAESADARRRRVVAHLQRYSAELAVDGRDERRRRWFVGGSALGVAAAAAALFLFGGTPLLGGMPGSEDASNSTQARSVAPSFVPLRSEMTQGSVVHRMGGTSTRLGLGDSPLLGEADVLETRDGSRARLHGGRGLDIDIGPDSRVVVGAIEASSGAAHIRLDRGRVDCSVDPAGQGRKLAVRTPDATVEVKGTVFSVEVLGEGSGRKTCVRVQRGLVSVRRTGATEAVGAGQSSGCGEVNGPDRDDRPDRQEAQPVLVTELPSEEPALKEQRMDAGSSGLPPISGPARSSTPPLGGVSSLAIQNGLFARGLAAERQGNLEEAARELKELLSRYPNTPLRSDAAAALHRIRSHGSPSAPPSEAASSRPAHTVE